uniref:Glycosyltransferase family 92 protein n=1 Tax=Acrobeloides nanus TaxID=290746 RepID=A0A914E6I0_9BILA
MLVFLRNFEAINHFVIISATYYPTSKIYPKNTAVMLFNAEVNVSTRYPLLCISYNDTHQISHPVHTRFAYAPVGVCRWTAFISTCPVVENMKNFTFTFGLTSSRQVEIPFRKASNRKLEVATCFSPLFYNENWQLLITTLEVYRHFGVSLQVFYIQSMIEEMFDLLEIYKKYDIAAIEPWATLDLGDQIKQDLGYDPNTQLDWRNQATAHTDCLLKYREAADFIIVGDIDDILFPRLAKSYFEEFQLLTISNPYAVGFIYNRYNTEIFTTKTIA